MRTFYRTVFIVLIYINHALAQDGKPDEFLSDPIALSVEVWEVLLESNSILSIYKNEPFRLKVPENPEQESYKIITDDKGEVHLLGFDLGIEEPVCESYLFRRSKLWGIFGSRATLEKCSKESNYLQCQALEGTVAYKNCREHVTETGDAVIIEMGTWYTVSYYFEIDMTLVVVLEGSVQAAAKIDTGLGPFTTVSAGQIWVSQPVCILEDLNIDLHGRIFEITFLPELTAKLVEFGLDYPYKAISKWTDLDNLAFPSNKITSYLSKGDFVSRFTCDEQLLPAWFTNSLLHTNGIGLNSLLDQIPTTSPE